MSDEEIITEAKKLTPLSLRLAEFLLYWYTDKPDLEFGFSSVRGFKEQLEAAIEFYTTTEKEWHARMIDNKTSLPFNDFFYYMAMGAEIKLPQLFINKLRDRSI